MELDLCQNYKSTFWNDKETFRNYKWRIDILEWLDFTWRFGIEWIRTRVHKFGHVSELLLCTRLRIPFILNLYTLWEYFLKEDVCGIYDISLNFLNKLSTPIVILSKQMITTFKHNKERIRWTCEVWIGNENFS